MNYETVIGLEIHVELNTKTKAYCSCKNEFGSEVNSNLCPVCLGLPGALPVLNKEVVEYAVKAGMAFGCEINQLSKQDRKNYFYPDTAKAYQISQFDIPICEGGEVEYIADNKGNTKIVKLERIQIEEDAGKMLHDDSFAGTLIDYNRSSVPLIEIVTEPDLRNSQDARAFLETLRSNLIAIGVTDGKMQEGSIRCDVNVSVRPKGSEEYGTRVEMKNVNTFSGAARAIDYEASRQIKVLEAGGVIDQETRRWNDAENNNEVLRTKEDANDYRYFPEPDLGVIKVDQELIDRVKLEIPELPYVTILRFVRDLNIPLDDATILLEDDDKTRLFEECVAIGGVDNENIINWILGDVSRELNENNKKLSESNLTARNLVKMISLIEDKTISNAARKTVIEKIMFTDKTPMEVVEEKGLAQVSDQSALDAIVDKVLADNPQTIEQYRAGRTNVVGFLVGQGMKASKGTANPAMLSEMIISKLKNS